MSAPKPLGEGRPDAPADPRPADPPPADRAGVGPAPRPAPGLDTGPASEHAARAHTPASGPPASGAPASGTGGGSAGLPAGATALTPRSGPRPPWWSPARVPARLRFPLGVYALCQLLLFGWWAAFYPGRVTGDSLTYLYEVSTSHWRADHSVAYDALLWISLQVTGGVAALTFVQTVAMAAALAYVCASLRDLGVHGRWSAVAAAVVAAAPMTGSFTVYVWKDVAYTVATLVAFGAVVRLTARRLRREHAVRDRSLRRQLLTLAAGCLGIGLFRNNGFPVIIAAGVLLVLLLPGMRRRIAVATAVPLVLTLGMNNLLYPALGVQMPRADEVYAFNYADIGVVYAERPDVFSAADLRLLRGIAPLSHWRGPGGDCHVADPLMHEPLDRFKAGRENGQLLALWGRLLTHHPTLVIGARLCRADIAWAFTGHTGMYPASNRDVLRSWSAYGLDSVQQLPYHASLRDAPLSYKLDHAATRAFEWTKAPDRAPLLWRGVNWTYLGYLLVAVAAVRRRRYELLALAALPVALQATVLAANPSPLWRYMCAALFVGVLTVPVVALAGPGRAPWERAGVAPPDAVAGPSAEGGRDTAPATGHRT
ncbi:hypothetical protein RVR_3113 [Actinacidiphila reveromycinica]|uniref:Glycosyltransferase RgtA/B/C/D-like domain-containing protein n=1 Tax=Actinacidiphila reveromycinica TaxID=659352 RepID=A0A7U3VN80_9ACTN|nr:DUF6020 family protein [Streptomyces sp. SN-593]BBA97393.1 hypothetical protein RVR_3113 [Streptomyces sp. SN-593]